MGIFLYTLLSRRVLPYYCWRYIGFLIASPGRWNDHVRELSRESILGVIAPNLGCSKYIATDLESRCWVLHTRLDHVIFLGFYELEVEETQAPRLYGLC
jgi:hypothetical protein